MCGLSKPGLPTRWPTHLKAEARRHWLQPKAPLTSKGEGPQPEVDVTLAVANSRQAKCGVQSHPGGLSQMLPYLTCTAWENAECVPRFAIGRRRSTESSKQAGWLSHVLMNACSVSSVQSIPRACPSIKCNPPPNPLFRQAPLKRLLSSCFN